MGDKRISITAPALVISAGGDHGDEVFVALDDGTWARITPQDAFPARAEATATTIQVVSETSIRVQIDTEDPLSFVYQTRAQIEDLIAKLQAAIA